MHISIYYYQNNIWIQIWSISESESIFSGYGNENLASDTKPHPNLHSKENMDIDMILSKSDRIQPFSPLHITPVTILQFGPVPNGESKPTNKPLKL